MILIPFSSGLDSTTLVLKAIQNKKSFETCYIEITNNSDKVKIEKQQRKKIKELFVKHFGHYISDREEIQIGILRNEVVELPQVPVWICGLLYSVRSSISEIQIGYCMNDDAISFIPDIKKIWNSYNSISDNKLPKLTFPLIKYKKQQSHRNLPDEIFQETFFCEMPFNVKLKESSFDEYSWEDCGRCASCERAKYDGTFIYYKRNQKKVENSLTFTEKNLEEVKAAEPFIPLDEPGNKYEQDYEVTRIEEK